MVATILIPSGGDLIPLLSVDGRSWLRNNPLGPVIPQRPQACNLFCCAKFHRRSGEARRGCPHRWLQSPAGEWWNVNDPAGPNADLITLAMFVFHRHWSDFLWPLVIPRRSRFSTTLRWACSSLASSFSLDCDRGRPVRWFDPAGAAAVRAAACATSCPVPAAMRSRVDSIDPVFSPFQPLGSPGREPNPAL